MQNCLGVNDFCIDCVGGDWVFLLVIFLAQQHEKIACTSLIREGILLSITHKQIISMSPFHSPDIVNKIVEQQTSTSSSSGIKLSANGVKYMEKITAFYEAERKEVEILDEDTKGFESPHVNALDLAELTSRIVVRIADAQAIV